LQSNGAHLNSNLFTSTPGLIPTLHGSYKHGVLANLCGGINTSTNTYQQTILCLGNFKINFTEKESRLQFSGSGYGLVNNNQLS
jgi:hypothetical protein